MGAAVQARASNLTAVIVAVRVKFGASTAGKGKPVKGEDFLLQWLNEQEEQEKQKVIDRLWI